MKHFRSFLVIFSFIFYGIISIPFNFLIFPMAKILLKKDQFIMFSSGVINKGWIFFVKYLEIIRLIKVSVKNPEKIKSIKNKVIVATHPSFVDIIILMSIIPNSTCFVKNSLTKNFIINNIVNSIFIPNDTGIEKLTTYTKKYLDLGFNVIIFPMGTRHRRNEYPKIKKGASLVALNAKKDIVPIRIYDSEDFVFINQPFYEGGKSTVKFDIEVMDTIKIDEYYNDSEIVTKKNITKAIHDALYA